MNSSSEPLPAFEDQVRFWDEWNVERRENSELSHRVAAQVEKVLNWVKSLGRSDMRLLDVGCGAGMFCSLLMPFGKVTGIDIAGQVLERARGRLHDVRFITGDFRATRPHGLDRAESRIQTRGENMNSDSHNVPTASEQANYWDAWNAQLPRSHRSAASRSEAGCAVHALAREVRPQGHEGARRRLRVGLVVCAAVAVRHASPASISPRKCSIARGIGLPKSVTSPETSCSRT